MNENELSNVIIGAAIEVHKELRGTGLMEIIYEEALCHELESRYLQIQRQKPIPVIYKDKTLKKPMYLDILVNDKVIIEAKAVESFNPIFSTQLLTYLRLSNKKLGLVINFGERFLKNGIHRVVNDL